MANDTNSENFVESYGVRIGLKREFNFAMKSQSQICDSLGRTRSKKAQNLVQVSTNSSHRQYKNGVALNEKEVKSDLVDAKKLSQVCDETTMFVVSEKEHKSDGTKSQVQNECEKEHKNDELETGVMQMQPASDKVKEEGDNNVIVPILACQLETPIKAVQSTLKKLEKGDSNVKSNGVDKERNNGSIITISIPRTSSKGFMEKKFPSKLKDLLSSGILEGLLVKYVRSIKVLFFPIFIYVFSFLMYTFMTKIRVFLGEIYRAFGSCFWRWNFVLL